MRRLRTACERAKRTLSSAMSTTVEVDSLADGNDLNIKLTRAKFEELCIDLFRKCMTPVEDALKTAKLSKSQVDEVVLVGGSTRIPCVQDLLSKYFNGKKLCSSINPDEAVAYGAAVQAAILAGTEMGDTDIVIVDATPLSLGVEVGGAVMEVLIPRGTAIPTKKSNTFSNGTDNQPVARIRVFEGERKMTKDNNLLGQFDLEGLPPARKGMLQIEITYDVDANGILNVSAVEKSTGKSNKIVITNEKGRLSASDIKRMIDEAEKYKEEDDRMKDMFTSKNSLESYIMNWRNTLSEEKFKEKISSDELQSLNSKLDETSKWLDEHSNEESKDVYDSKLKELEAEFNPMAARVYQSMDPNMMANMMNGGQMDPNMMANMMNGDKDPNEESSGLDEEGTSSKPNGPVIEEVD